jgi:hypothetical protein
MVIHFYCSRAFTNIIDESCPRQGDNFHRRHNNSHIIYYESSCHCHWAGSYLEITNAKKENTGKYKCEVAIDKDKRPEVVHPVGIQGYPDYEYPFDFMLP